MLKITCFKCRWSWSLNQAEVANALAALETDASHYATECPRCRRVNKVPRKQLERVRPHAISDKDSEK